MPSKAEIEEFLAELTATEKYDEEEGFHYWDLPDGGKLHAGVCTNSARLVANRFNGEVKGYSTTQESLVGGICFGHDFAIVGDLLVDWWAKTYEEKPAIWDLNHPDLPQHYGNPTQWETMPHQ